MSARLPAPKCVSVSGSGQDLALDGPWSAFGFASYNSGAETAEPTGPSKVSGYSFTQPASSSFEASPLDSSFLLLAVSEDAGSALGALGSLRVASTAWESQIWALGPFRL